MNEIGEDLGMKVLQLEEKTNKLESAFSRISKESAAVLTDIRAVLSELENPMNYLKGLGIDEVMITMAENITEKKLKEFMEKRLEGLVRTVVEGKLKEILESMVIKCIQEQAGSIIEAKIKEMKEKGLLNVPINVDELKKALDEKLKDFINSGEIKPQLEKFISDFMNERGDKIIEAKCKEDLESLRTLLFEDLMKALSDPISKVYSNQVTKNGNNIVEISKDRPPSTSLVGIMACANVLINIFGKRGAERAVDEYYRMGWFSESLKSSLLRALSVIDSKDVPEIREAKDHEHLVVTYLFEKLMRGAPDIDFLITLGLLSKANGEEAQCQER
ncbi:MAG: FlaD/FlaE family flagellar protein [Candidatus Methanomethyliaceae archaeon]